MKKLFSLLVLAFSFSLVFTACSSDDDNNYVGDGDTVPEVYNYTGVTFSYDGNNQRYFFNDTFNTLAQESILMYMQSDLANGGRAWVLLPNDIDYIDGGVGYNVAANFDYTSTDFQIYINPNGTSLPPRFVDINFRVVVLPGIIMNGKTAVPEVDYKDYDAVIKYYKIDESKMKVKDFGSKR